jgi:hypothetical protein
MNYIFDNKIQKYLSSLWNHRIRPVLISGIIIYVCLTLGFGCLYWLLDCLTFNPVKDIIPGFWDSIYFSYTTFMTIGFGDIIPANNAGHIVVYMESFLALLFTPVFGSFLAYKFLKRPNDIHLTDHFYIRYRNNNIFLSTRLGNKGKHIIDCNATVEFIQIQNNVKRTLLSVQFNKPIVLLTWYFDIRLDGPNSSQTLAHLKSLLANPTTSIIRVTAIGIDSVTGNTVHVYKHYEMNDLQYGGSFSEVYHWEGTQRTIPNWSKFNSIKPLTPAEMQKIEELLN